MSCGRSRHWKRVVAGVVAGVAAAAGAGAATSLARTASSSATGGSGAPLIVNISTAMSSLDPTNTYTFVDAIALNMYVRLTQYGTNPGPDGTRQFDPSHIVPYLARSWKITNGGKVYTMKLHMGLRFPSGTPVDSKAVKYSFDRAIASTAGAYFLVDGLPGNILKVEAPKPDTVVIRLKQPDPNVLQGWAQPAASIVDPTVVKAHPKTWLASHEAGSGPFKLVSYQPNGQLVLAARPSFEKWWGSSNGASKITVNFINSDPTLLLQARSGAADVTIGLSNQSTKSLVGQGRVRVIANPTTLTEQVLIPWNEAPWDNAKVREAVTLAVPYDQIVKNVAYGYGKLFYGPLPPLMKYSNASLEKPLGLDLAKAAQLIKNSGLPVPINVTLTIEEGNAVHQQIATILQGLWNQIGINLQVQTLSTGDYTTAMFGGKVQAAIRTDGPGVIDAGYYLGYDMRCNVIGIGVNLSHMCISEADTLLNRARASSSAPLKQQLFDQITTLWRKQHPKIVLYNDVAATVLGKSVTSWTYNQEADMRTWAK